MAGHQSQPEENQLAVALETAVVGRATLHVKAVQGPLWVRFALFASDAVVAAAVHHMALKHMVKLRPGNCHMLNRSPGADLNLQGTPAASSQSIIPTPHQISMFCPQKFITARNKKRRFKKKNGRTIIFFLYC